MFDFKPIGTTIIDLDDSNTVVATFNIMRSTYHDYINF